MNFLRICLIFLLFTQTAMAKKGGAVRDPFHRTEPPQTEQDIAFEEKEPPQSLFITSAVNCQSTQPTIAQTLSFQQLFLIGAIQQKNGGKVLFRDPQNNVFIVSEGEFIGLEQMKLHKVGNKTVEFIGWQADCSETEPLRIDF